MEQIKSKIKPKMFDMLPDEGRKKIETFREAFKVYFSSQRMAGEILLVRQEAISRYLSGANLLPLEVAVRFQEHTKGMVKADSIFFDYHAYMYMQKKDEKENKLTKN